jgi:Rieske 2Fe-2S family protein
MLKQPILNFAGWLMQMPKKGKDYATERLTEFWEVTGDQDGKLCENNFTGIKSIAYKPGPYAPVEDQVINFVDWCVKELKEGMKLDNAELFYEAVVNG